MVARTRWQPLADESRSGAPTAHGVGELLREASRIPSLAIKYRSFLDEPGAEPPLDALPVLRREELSRAVEEVIDLNKLGRTWGEASSLWAVGGSLGSPGLSLLPEDLYVAQVRRSWSPVGPADVVANLHPLERMRPDHQFFHRFTTESGATALPFGRLPSGKHDDWPDLFARLGVTAIAAPAESVCRLLGDAVAGRPLPWLRTLLLGGAGLDRTPDRAVADCFPYTEVWRLYGSPATGPIGQRGPLCLADVYHPLEHQHVEVVDGRLLVTTFDPGRKPPLIRYDTGDRGEYARCVCGRPGPAVRLFDPSSPFFRLHGRTVSAQELVELALGTGDVVAAHVAVDRAGHEERAQLRVRLAPGVPDDSYTLDWIRYQVLENHLVMTGCVLEHPDAFEVVTADESTGASAGSALVHETF
ncbi:hypothetical protein AB0A69_09550 [Streptomyces sp. NPDC045431]|uniref:hypothetical protein n=1 Tax=Streptomyces sp. NPDC045431 TaxID=3155613 RepID=UPI00340183AC